MLLIVIGVLALAVVVLNWTYGRLPAEPKPTGSFIQVGKLRIHYIEHPGAGTPVVLIHGLPGTAADWEDVTPLLAGHRTIAIDRPGFGYSTGGYVPFDRQLEVDPRTAGEAARGAADPRGPLLRRDHLIGLSPSATPSECADWCSWTRPRPGRKSTAFSKMRRRTW